MTPCRVGNIRVQWRAVPPGTPMTPRLLWPAELAEGPREAWSGVQCVESFGPTHATLGLGAVADENRAGPATAAWSGVESGR